MMVSQGKGLLNRVATNDDTAKRGVDFYRELKVFTNQCEPGLC
jgi:hypothetical protein